MYNLFLDDIRHPSQVANYILPIEAREQYLKEDWVIVRNYEEFVKVIDERGLPNKVSFDHDLADIHYDPKTWTEGFVYQEKTGLDCAKYLIEKIQECVEVTIIIDVHSQNPIGAENIRQLFFNYAKHRNNES